MSQSFILENTATAQWQALLKQAEAEYGCQLDETMESYLVFALMRFMKDRDLASVAVALNYLQAQGMHGKLRDDQLRDVGDQCLILSGLFPKQAERRMVRVSYYVDMGRSAYDHLSKTIQNAASELYEQLCDTFILLMELLHTIRGFNSPALSPLQNYELWCDKNTSIDSFNGSLPVHEALLNNTKN